MTSEAVLMGAQNLRFEQKKEKYNNFSSEHSHFTLVTVTLYCIDVLP